MSQRRSLRGHCDSPPAPPHPPSLCSCVCVSSSHLPSDFICQRHASPWVHSSTSQALQHPLRALSPPVVTEGNRDTCWQGFPGETSGSAQTVLIKNARGHARPLIYTANRVRAALAPRPRTKESEAKSKNPSAGTH